MTFFRIKRAPFGELVAIAFDKAAQYSSDPGEIARLASMTVASILTQGRWHAPTSWPVWGERREA